MKQDPLDHLLMQWQPQVAVPPAFGDDVWRRVRETASDGASPRWRLRWLGAAAAALVAGILAGAWSPPDPLAEDRAVYLGRINPFTMTHER